jgi:hypothetical protein
MDPIQSYSKMMQSQKSNDLSNIPNDIPQEVLSYCKDLKIKAGVGQSKNFSNKDLIIDQLVEDAKTISNFSQSQLTLITQSYQAGQRYKINNPQASDSELIEFCNLRDCYDHNSFKNGFHNIPQNFTGDSDKTERPKSEEKREVQIGNKLLALVKEFKDSGVKNYSAIEKLEYLSQELIDLHKVK